MKDISIFFSHSQNVFRCCMLKLMRNILTLHARDALSKKVVDHFQYFFIELNRSDIVFCSSVRLTDEEANTNTSIVARSIP